MPCIPLMRSLPFHRVPRPDSSSLRTTLRRLGLAAILLLAGALQAAGPVEFRFVPPKDDAIKNPFARELWAEVITPSGQTVALPAFYCGDNVFAVRARPEETGTYRFGHVSETTAGKPRTNLTVSLSSPAEVPNAVRTRLPAIGRDPHDPRALLRSDGRLFVPVGANLAWPEGECGPYYRDALAAFARANLNWMRVWMVHWGRLNLDWLPEDMGPSPRPGGIDARVAANWDALLAAAETQGVYVQVVLQHHGQFTTGANSNWADNPWNAARPGGFLRSPSDFFTDPNALLLTLLKYRYIVARWGWSPAVVAWELFNEVHWVDAIDKEKNEAAVARWHDHMADFLRSVDAYHHLVTTSTDNLRSPVYAKMDFSQPHLYAANLIAGARSFPPAAGAPDHPVFYGEFGSDHLPASAEAKQAGLDLIPPVWASVMGPGGLPAQPWAGATLLRQGRLGELGAVYRFLALSGFFRHHDLAPFSAVTESAVRVPLVLPAGQIWQRRPAPEFTLPLDGREPLELADVPGIYVGSAASRADGFPGRFVFHADFPRDTILRVHVAEVGGGGGALRMSVDGTVAAESRWPGGPALPAELAVPVPAGPRTVAIENSGGADWVRVSGIDLGLDTSVLAAIGRRNDRFIALWLWHRTNLFAPGPLTPATGVVVLDDVPAGTWQVTWWDTRTGVAATPVSVVHPGGPLRLPTPAISRHAAVVLTR